MSVCSVGPRVGGAAVRIGACRKAEVVSPKANPPRATPKRCVPKSGSREPEGQLAEWQTPKRKAEEPTRRGQPRSGACRKAEAVSPKVNPPSGNLRNGSPKANPPSGNSETEGNAERRKPPEPRAVKPAGRSRETRGRRSSADTPTNTIEKRDCDTLKPSEAS